MATFENYQNQIKTFTDNMLTYEKSELQTNISISNGQTKEVLKSKLSRVLREMAHRSIL